jgi:hypothetical protein
VPPCPATCEAECEPIRSRREANSVGRVYGSNSSEASLQGNGRVKKRLGGLCLLCAVYQRTGDGEWPYRAT